MTCGHFDWVGFQLIYHMKNVIHLRDPVKQIIININFICSVTITTHQSVVKAIQVNRTARFKIALTAKTQ